MNRVKKLFELSIGLLLEVDMLLNDVGNPFDPTFAEHIESLIELVDISLNVIQNAVGSVLSFFALFENLHYIYLLIFKINLVQAFWIDHVI